MLFVYRCIFQTQLQHLHKDQTNDCLTKYVTENQTKGLPLTILIIGMVREGVQ